MLYSLLSFKNIIKNKEISNIMLFSVASSISLLGTAIYNFAIGLYVLRITGSGLSFAVTLSVSVLSTILVNPFAGVLTDRLDKKLLAIITDMLNGILFIGLYVVTCRSTLNLSMIYVSTFLLNVFTTVYGISIEAVKANLVSDEKLISMNSIIKVIESTAAILGPAIGGIVFISLDIKFFVFINGLSFALSAVLQLFIDFNFNCNESNKVKAEISFIADIVEGITFLKTEKNIINMFKIFIVLNFCIGLSIEVPMPYIINNILRLDANFLGVINGAWSLGMILGAFLIKGVMKKYSYTEIVRWASILLSFSMVAIGFSVILYYELFNEIFYLIYFILIMIIAGIAISFIDIPLFYILQKDIPEEFRGRVLCIGISVAKIVLPMALIMSGGFINSVPAYFLPIAGGLVLCIFSIRKIMN
ncbi:MFS transporter [Clostridium saccharoperbutylacetonicum]|uniref:MFS transporter n=1 Tax=Clostridium saccharoperbutylacetonicum TaxID=36745 RepID=UPI000983A4FF|nr:MFS transporter [Clostridium saccharoperbutylacetonicum]AQR96019.1 putative bacilysin exporter BacE [Clostridium saccharoperbutylacetonicum]NSB31886.1 MFS family permease [Clostridium saccharoperbutylacetonicum]